MTELVTTTELAKHLRLDDQSSPLTEEAELSQMIQAARVQMEDFLQRSIVAQTRVMRMGQFPAYDYGILLPKGPVTGVTSIAYTDIGGVGQTYTTYDLNGDYLYPDLATSAVWPSSSGRKNSVVITYTAEETDANALIVLKSANLLLAADFYTHREAQTLNLVYHQNQRFRDLIIAYRKRMGI